MPASSARRDGMLVMNAHDSRPHAVVQDVVDQRGERDQREHHRQQAEGAEQPVAHVAQRAPRRHGGDVERHRAHAYSSRNRFRSQIDTRFSTKVLRNSSMPTAKIVRYSSVPAGVSPRLTCTM